MRVAIASATSLLVLIGTVVPAAEPIPLRAGPVTMLFDPDLAFLRYLRIGQLEVLRGINAPIRDQHWGTVLPKVTHLRVDDQGDHFTVAFDAMCRQRDIDFLWHGTITGTAAGQIEFTFDGQARSTFLRNRIGFCVLHGPSAAGQPWVIEHTDGAKSDGRFPSFISPHQPAKNIRAIAHQVAEGVWGHVRFEGEVFEMEDQRNWTDASFKTYCTPLEIPYPVKIDTGTKISQKVRLRVEGDIAKLLNQRKPPGDEVVLTVADNDAPVAKLPRMGLQMSSQTEALTELELARLRALNLDHLRVNLTGSGDAVADKLRRAAEQAGELGVTLHAGLRLGGRPDVELEQLASAVQRIRPPVSLWLLVAADAPTIELAKRYLRPSNEQALFGAGYDTNFTELNRNRPDSSQLETIAYGMNPQIHAFDNASIIETLPIQGDTVRSAMQFAAGLPVVVSPITLRPQQANGQRLAGQLPADVDVRQPTLFLAAWTVGSVKFLAEAGASSLTYFETVGWKGVTESERGSPEPDLFPSRPREVFAIYHVLRDIGEFRGGEVRGVDSTDPLSVIGLCMKKGARTRTLIANLTDRQQSVRLHGLTGDVLVYRLDSHNLPSANVRPDAFHHRSGEAAHTDAAALKFELPPHGIVRIDQGGV